MPYCLYDHTDLVFSQAIQKDLPAAMKLWREHMPVQQAQKAIKEAVEAK